MKCSIDSNTREIIFLDNSECFGVEFDKNTQRIEFSCPKIVGDNLDLTKCTCRINYMNAKGFRDSYLIDDILVDGDNITFTWALKSKVTAGRGICLFIFCARQVNENGVIEKEWNTTVAKASIKRGLETNSHIEEEYSDILESILLKINSVSLTTEVNAESTNENVPTAKAVYDALQDIDIPSGTPDWAQNDPNGAGYIKNRCGGYDDVQTKESEIMSINCPADGNNARAYAPTSFFPPSAGDVISVTVDGSTKEYTVAEETIEGRSFLWFGTQNPSSVTDFDVFFASDKWVGVLGIDKSGMAINMNYGSLSEIAGKTVGLKQRHVLVAPVKISRRYLDVDETAIKITENGAIYSPSITDDGSSLGKYAVNLGKGKGGATGAYSFTSGSSTTASGMYSAAFGDYTTASGWNSAAFGDYTTASGRYSAAFGIETKASGLGAATFGSGTNASGSYSAAFGYGTKANRYYSAAFGRETSATTDGQFVCGMYNDETIGNNYLFVVGSGNRTAKKNGLAVTTNGEIVLPDPNATSTTYMKARFNSDGTITLIPLADETKSYTTECTANRVMAITAESTDAQYPTAKAVYDALQDVVIPSGTDVSLGVTGATVGQTIKVKAVDANGKPTAWEAVDMAAGDTWETLAETTLEEESVPILDIGAMASSFSRLRFYFTFPIVESVEKVHVSLAIPNTTTGPAYNVASINRGNDKSESWAFIDFYPLIYNGICYMSMIESAKVGTTNNTTQQFQYNSYDYYRISEARYVRTSKPLPTGATITIMGVRK